MITDDQLGELYDLVIVLWDKAVGHPDYSKKEWQTLQNGLGNIAKAGDVAPGWLERHRSGLAK